MATSTQQSHVPARIVGTTGVYRPDVDGLRSIAVTAVVLFHAGLTALSGGYIGVDVFFVISGYLITRQVVAGVQRGGFSFVEFYTRRIRRLMPAALTTAALALLFALLFLPAFRLAEIAKSVAAAALSVSNIFFWQETSYWADESAVQPLLHTWSLSVEEQFYLVWPLLIVLSLRWFRRATLPILIVGTFVSIAVTTWATTRSPDAAFYLTPFRTYEFAIGALCVWVERLRWPDSRIGRVMQSGSWLLGMVLIVFAMLTFNEAGTAFPGWHALVPTVGTALVIAARRPAGLDRVLDNPVMQYIGLRSYSLYLVHWPVLVFAQELFGPLTLLTATACIVLTAVLAELQYRYVEYPLRVHSAKKTVDAQDVPTKVKSGRERFVRLAVPVLATAVVVAGAAGVAWSYAKSPLVYPASVRPVAELDREALNEVRRAPIGELCAARSEGSICGVLSDAKPNVLVIGDSFGADGLNIARGIAPEANFLVSERPACPPLQSKGAGEGGDADCIRLNAYRVPAIDDMAPRVDLVVLSMKFTELNRERAMDRIAELVALGTPVAVIGQGAHYDQEAWQTVLEHGSLNGVEGALFDHLDVTAEQNAALAEDVTALGASYVDRWEWMCDDHGCRAYVDDVQDLVMYDTAHMTAIGASAFVEAVREDSDVKLAFHPALAD
ncbi:acyltransferase family protein [Microbacterium sp. JZ101]